MSEAAILDLYSRELVGWEVHETDHSDHAVHLVRRAAPGEGIAYSTVKPVLHGDNRLHPQGDASAGDAQLAGREALVLAPPREGR